MLLGSMATAFFIGVLTGIFAKYRSDKRKDDDGQN